MASARGSPLRRRLSRTSDGGGCSRGSGAYGPADRIQGKQLLEDSLSVGLFVASLCVTWYIYVRLRMLPQLPGCSDNT